MRKEGKLGNGKSESKGTVGLCALQGLNWTEVQEIWDVDGEMWEDVIGLIGKDFSTSNTDANANSSPA